MKIADKKHWSYQIFHERLENQLIGLYLADERHRFGIFLLVNQGRTFWQRAGRSRASFEVMIEELQSHADLLIKNRPDIAAVTVIGINLQHRKEVATLVSRKRS